jgi:hypothetical protein
MSRTTDSRFERACDAILDRDSTAIYGDERDRYHWYEAIAVGASIQWVAIPWALAILAAIDADRFGPALWVLFAVWLVPIIVMNAYAQRRRVSEVSYRSRTALVTVLATFVPMLAFLAIMLWRSDVDMSLGTAVGSLVGTLVGFALLVVIGVVIGVVRERRGR